MGLLTEETVSVSGSGFADGIEFEETFPDVRPSSLIKPAAVAAPALLTQPPTPKSADRPSEPAHDATEAIFQERLDRRLREAESLVKQTIERMRLDEEQRLAQWVQDRRAEEQRRLAAWMDERRALAEHSAQQRATDADGLAERLQQMLAEWQVRFEQRFEQRRADEAALAERRRLSDEERLNVWRIELERTLTDRLTQREITERASLPDRNGEVRVDLRDPLATASSARDVGRILRDRFAELTHTSALAIALHDARRDEVVYRYRIAADDELGALLRRDALDDGPLGAAANSDGWTRAQRTVRMGQSNVTVHTAQHAIRAAGGTIGVVTLQTEGTAIDDSVLAKIFELAAPSAPRLVTLRDRGSFKGA